jgi:hypothetical protein
MRNFLKKIFGKKEPESVTIAFDSIPGMLDARETAARSTLREQTQTPEQDIRNAVAQLQLIVNAISGAEHDPAIHPKLKSIAKNTLPQYIRAMNTALSKELPEDSEEFYLASVECVKSCLNNLNGPGRYLQIVFPDEMKASRTGINAIGHEINAITAALGTFRKEMTAVSGARTLYTTILGSIVDVTKSAEKNQRTRQRIEEITGRLFTIGQELAAMPADPRMVEVEEKRSSLHELEQHLEEKTRTYAALSMTASHVLRKAEKIATKQKHTGEIATLKHAMALLSDHELPDSRELETALAAACPVVERMIGADEITLKNKEERAVFSDTARFCSDMSQTCADLRTQDDACRKAQEALHIHPLLVKAESLEREKTQLETMLEKEQQSLKDLSDWQQKTQDRIPFLREELAKKVGEIIEKDVQFSDEHRTSA